MRAVLQRQHPVDVADLLDTLPPAHALLVFNLLSEETASEVLDETSSLVRQTLLEDVEDERLVVVSAPLITTIVDATGLAIYFGLAKWILGI